MSESKPSNAHDYQAGECQNCGKVWKIDDLKPIKNLLQRVSAGEPMPAGECPDCGCLAAVV